ncbi:hypothetical protein [Umezawaea tangerina]|uniref:Uncharacterized protein n=1 Tax=Umezawaea tangerina TaxID=84725 RepID=A0A2T0SPP0_9PSEU|nr:hypothetical protein [Umezawaea tangerina]PRY35366.1 hypothetical protein CLV43_114284 [Umezawaea tangerina]
MTTDYSTAVLTTVSGGVRTVEQADDLIGVHDDLVQALTRTGVLDGDHLTLDTAGEYRYRRLGPSETTPGVTRYERVHSGPSKADS